MLDEQAKENVRKDIQTILKTAIVVDSTLDEYGSELCERLERTAEALEAVQDLIDDALMVGVGTVTILHGKGTGALKEEIRRYLRTVPEVVSAVDEHADRGGAGITIVTLS